MREREREERVYQIEVVTLSYISGALTTTLSLSLSTRALVSKVKDFFLIGIQINISKNEYSLIKSLKSKN